MDLNLIKQGHKLRHTITWPGTDHAVDLRILSEAEIQQVKAATDTYCKKLYGDYGAVNADAWEDERNLQTLYRALRPVGKDTPLRPTIEEFRDDLVAPDVRCLVDEYNALEADIDPAQIVVDEDQLNEVVDELEKKPEMLATISSSITLKKLLLISAARSSSSRPPSSTSSSDGQEADHQEKTHSQDNSSADEPSKTKGLDDDSDGTGYC